MSRVSPGPRIGIPSTNGPSVIASAGLAFATDNPNATSGIGRDAVNLMSVATPRPMFANSDQSKRLSIGIGAGVNDYLRLHSRKAHSQPCCDGRNNRRQSCGYGCCNGSPEFNHWMIVPMPYDLVVNAKGAGTKEVVYSVFPVPPTAITKDEFEEFQAKKPIDEVVARLLGNQNVSDVGQGSPEMTYAKESDHVPMPTEPVVSHNWIG